ncbi:MAG: TnpV protein [Eubacteriales bacterium]
MEQNNSQLVEEQDIEVQEDENYLGHWGRKRENYLKNYKKSIYKEFKTSGYLEEHLKNIDRDADRMEDFLVSRMAELEGVTEELKQADQMGWVGAMNNIVYRAREIVDSELIFT